MRVLRINAAIILCAGLLAACQPMPHPFAPEESVRHNPLLRLPDRAGIVVLDVDGAPQAVARAFPDALTKALLERNIPAWTSSGNRASRFLQARAKARPLGEEWLEIDLIWDLVDAGGGLIGNHTVSGKVRRAAWENGAPALIVRYAARSAKGIAALMQDPAPRYASPPPGSLHVVPVAGAPGDGRRALRIAMAAALRGARLNVIDEINDDTLVVAGSVALGRIERGRRDIEIIWSILRADGTEIGNLKQRNAVPEGALNGAWGELAFIVARAATGGILDLLRRPSTGVSSTAPQNARRDGAR